MERPGPAPDVTPDDVLEVFDRLDEPCTPLTASDVAGELDCSRRTAHRKLEKLVDRGDMNSKKTGARGRVWWRQHGHSTVDAGTAARDRLELEQFGAFVDAVEDYAIFMLDPDGLVINWNEGAERIKGYGEEQIVGEHVSTFYPEEAVADGRPEANLETAAAEGRCEDEGWRVRDDGTRFWANIVITAIYDEAGNLKGFTKVTRDLTERREYEQELREERDFVEKILETVPVGISVLSAEGEFVRANSRVLERLDIEASEIAGRSPDPMHHYDEAGDPIPREELPWATVARTGEPVSNFECWIDLPDGGKRWLSINAAPLEDGEGSVVVVADDITERKEHEQQLRRERDQTEELLKTAPIAIAVQDEDGEILLANRRARDALGSPDGDPFDDLVSTEDGGLYDENGEALDPAETPWARARATREPVIGEEIVVEDRTGDRMWFVVNAAPVLCPGGNLERVITAADEITDLKERERQLERRKDELETELSEILGRVSDAFFALDEEWRFTHVNERAEELLDPDGDGLLDGSIWEEFEPAVGTRFEEEYRRAMENQEPTSFEEYYPPLDTWFEVNAYPSETGLSVYFRDVTERVERERELAESRHRYRTLVENFPNGAVALVDEDLRYTTVGGDPIESGDVTTDDLRGGRIPDVLSDELADLLVPRYEAALDGESRSFEAEYRDRVYQFRILPVRDDDGAVFAAMGMSQDVTERNERERLLEEQRERYRRLVDVAPVAIATYDAEGIIRFANDAAADLAGVSDSDDIAGTRALDFVHPDDRDESAERIRTVIDGREAVPSREMRFLADGGDQRNTIATSVPITFDGEPAAQVVLTDITEQKERERDLARYEILFEESTDVNAVVAPDGTFRYFTPSVTRVLGYDRDELVGEDGFQYIHPDDREEAMRAFAEMIEDPSYEPRIEFRFRHADGSWVVLETLGRNLLDEPQIGGIVAYTRDITERKQREAELERYRTIVQTVNDGVYTVDDRGCFTMVNDSYADMTGYSREELLGAHVSKVVGEDTVERVRTIEGELVEGGRDRAKFEADVLTADGGTIRAEATFSVLPNEDREYERVGVVRDITDRVERERALEESERRYRTLVENFPGGTVALFDEDLEFVTVGGQLLDDMGVSPDDVVGSPILERFPEDIAADVEGHFRDALAGEQSSFDVEYEGRNLLAYTLPVRDADDEVYAGMLVVQDVTERREYRRELEKTIDKLEESNERLEQFAYVASHDLQEPLRMVSNYLQLLEQRYGDDLDDDGREFIEFAVDGADRMREMIDDLLAYSRVETKAEPFEPTDTRAVLDAALDQLRLQIEESGGVVDVGDLPTVSADENQLEQVFQNLVSNALKYSGEEPPRIEIDATERADGWRFRVTDDGIGMAPEHTDRIFEVFRRLHTHEEYPGTGIGLALCRKIVERHGGDIWVESEPGEGSTFYFTIPNGEGP